MYRRPHPVLKYKNYYDSIFASTQSTEGDGIAKKPPRTNTSNESRCRFTGERSNSTRLVSQTLPFRDNSWC